MSETTSQSPAPSAPSAPSPGPSAVLLGMFAETPIHPGAGRSTGAIDLPVAREAATDYPVIVGSSLKGALQQRATEHDWSTAGVVSNSRAPDVPEPIDRKADLDPVVQDLFGWQNYAGDLLIADARLLLLPVRSLTSTYRWVTCPHVLERLHRDLQRAGITPGFEVPAEPIEGHAGGKPTGNLFLEELQFTVEDSVCPKVVTQLKKLIPHAHAQGRLESQLTLLRDNDFAHFARYALNISARNQLDADKQSKNLWYEETLPPDTLMYSLIAQRDGAKKAVETLIGMFDNSKDEQRPYFQAGGNETVGQGWFAVSILK